MSKVLRKQDACSFTKFELPIVCYFMTQWYLLQTPSSLMTMLFSVIFKTSFHLTFSKDCTVLFTSKNIKAGYGNTDRICRLVYVCLVSEYGWVDDPTSCTSRLCSSSVLKSRLLKLSVSLLSVVDSSSGKVHWLPLPLIIFVEALSAEQQCHTTPAKLPIITAARMTRAIGRWSWWIRTAVSGSLTSTISVLSSDVKAASNALS